MWKSPRQWLGAGGPNNGRKTNKMVGEQVRWQDEWWGRKVQKLQGQRMIITLTQKVDTITNPQLYHRWSHCPMSRLDREKERKKAVPVSTEPGRVRRLLVNNRVLLIKEGRTGKNGLSCWRVTMFRSDMDHRCYVPDYWQSETVRKIKKMLDRKCQNKSSSEPKSKQINPVSGLNRDCSKHGLKPLLLYNVYHSNDCGVVLSAIKVERDRVWCILLQRLFIYHRRVHSLQPAVQGHHCVSDLPDMLSPISNSHMPLYCFARYCTSQFKATKAAVMPLALAGRVSPNRCETTKIKCLQKIPFFPHQITIPVESEEGTGRAPVRFSHLSVTVETANSDVKYPSPWEQKEMERARREEEMYGISRGCH